MVQEIWKDVQDYETLYAVSNFGRVKSYDVERKLGFCNVSISKCCNGKQKTAYGYNWKYKQKDVK